MTRLSTLSRGLAACASLIVGTAACLVVADPASAVPGRTIVVASTPVNLDGFKLVTATCPAGARALGGGGNVGGGNGVVQLNHLGPTADGSGMAAVAYSHGGYRDGELIVATAWSLTVWAICAAGIRSVLWTRRWRRQTPRCIRTRPRPPMKKPPWCRRL